LFDLLTNQQKDLSRALSFVFDLRMHQGVVRGKSLVSTDRGKRSTPVFHINLEKEGKRWFDVEDPPIFDQLEE